MDRFERFMCRRYTVPGIVLCLFVGVLVAAAAAYIVPIVGVSKWEGRVFWTFLLGWFPATLIVAWVDERGRR